MLLRYADYLHHCDGGFDEKIKHDSCQIILKQFQPMSSIWNKTLIKKEDRSNSIWNQK